MIWLFLFLFLAGVILGGSYYAYRIAFHAPEHLREKIPSTGGTQYNPFRPRMRELYQTLASRPCEYVTVRSQDGLLLSGRYYHTADGAPLDICFHGYKSHPLTDFSGGSQLCLNLGHNLLLVDQRGHHRSQGSTIAFGIQERKDVLTWIHYAMGRFGSHTPMTLFGISMGGATVLMASGLPLPSCVKGIVADCPYAIAEDIILDVGRKMHYPAGLIRPFLHLGAWLYGCFRLSETDALRAVRQAKVPILIIHGEDDHFVPCEMSAGVPAANPELVTRHTFPGADHGISYLVDTPRYTQLVTEFLNQILA